MSRAPAGDASSGDGVAIELDAVQVGRAAGVGRVIAGDWAGRRVLVGPCDPCGECDVCRRGGAAVCPQAHRRDALGAEVVAARRWLVALDDGLDLPSPAAAAVAGDVALAYTLYARTAAAPREPVVVVGASPTGRFLIEILLAKGIAPAAIAGPGRWADWLATRGAVVARDRAALGEAFAAQGLGSRPWRVICVDPAAADAAIELAGPRATLSLLATPAPAISAAGIAAAIARDVAILGIAGPHPELVVEAAALCVKGEVDLAAGTTTEASPESQATTMDAALPRTQVRHVR